MPRWGWIGEPEKILKILRRELVCRMSELPTLCRKFRWELRIWTKYKISDEPGKSVWIKSLPICSRVTCKWTCAMKQHTKVDRAKTNSRSTRTRYEHEEQVTQDLFPKFTPTKGATSPLRSSQRAGLPYNPFPHPINHPRRIEYLLCKSTKDWGNTNFPGRTHTREDAPRATTNRLEASFKSNKRESKNGDASSAHEREVAPHTSQISSLTLKSSSHPSPSLNLSRNWLFEGVRRSFGSLRVCLSRGGIATSEEAAKGYL